MNVKTVITVLLVLASTVPAWGGGKKDGELERGMLEKMEAVPCGANQKGLSGLGTLWASAGITRVTSNEKLCPQYLLRTDEMDYEIRPKSLKHTTILPVGQEGEFRIKKNEMLLTFREGQDRKTRTYQVVGMNPNRPDNADEKSSSLDTNGH
jgi:hypothetical protein